jgi:hypothetical protein
MFKQFAKLQNSLESCLKNKNVIFLLGVLTFLYTVFAGPEFPESISRVFNNNVFKTLVIFTVAYLTSAKDARVALFVSIVFIFITNLLGEQSLYERFTNYKYMENFQDEVAEDDTNEEDLEQNDNDSDEQADEDDDNDVEAAESTGEESSEEGVQEVPEEATEENTPKESKPLKLKLQCTAIEEAFGNY